MARSSGEKRLARLWTANSYLHDAAPDMAPAEIQRMVALAEADQDLAAVSGDLSLMGDILRDAGRLEEAAAKYAASVSTMDKAEVPAEVKQVTHRNLLFEEGRLAVARKDLAKAIAVRAADFNALNFNYGYLRSKARQLAGG